MPDVSATTAANKAAAASSKEQGGRVELIDISKRFGNVEALRSVSLSIEAGERLVLCGPSGSGKSTLLRTINALELPDTGRIRLDGREIDPYDRRAVETLRRQVGMVFQQFNLFPHLSVLDNICLAPTVVLGRARSEVEAEALALLERVHIPEQAHKFPAELSGGQRQRVAIARALAMRPRVMLFDEPTSALDPEMIKEVLDVMLELGDSGMTLIVVTHEMGFARRFANRVAFLDAGELVEVTPCAQFFSAPASARAQAFLARILER